MGVFKLLGTGYVLCLLLKPVTNSSSVSMTLLIRVGVGLVLPYQQQSCIKEIFLKNNVRIFLLYHI